MMEGVKSLSSGSRLPLTALGLAVVAMIVLPLAPAGAHAAYKTSDPPDESTVASTPSSVWAEFTEPPTDESNLKVYGPCGDRVDPGDSTVSGYRITVSVQDAHAGTYRVDFDVASKLDGHGTDGSFTFTSTGGEQCPGEDGETDDGSAGDEGDGSGPEGTGSGEASGSDDGNGSSGSVGSGSDADEASGSGAGKGDPSTKAGAAKKRDKAEDQPAGSDDQELAGGTLPEEEKPGIWHGIPLSGFLMAMTVAALIGAAGGRIYAGIMGPKQ